MPNRTFVSFDWALKHILRDKANFVVLEGFLSELLHDDITILELLESEGNKASRDDKSNRVDLLVKTGKDERIIIEVQNDHELDYFQRMSYGAAKALTETIQAGQRYTEVKRVISVNIVYFDLGIGNDYIYHGSTSFQGLHQGDQLKLSSEQKRAFASESIGELFPEYYLIKISLFQDITKDTLDEWIYFLRNSDIRPEFKAKGLAEARQRLAILQMSQSERAEYESYMKDCSVLASTFWSHKFLGRYEALQEFQEKINQAEADKQKAEADKQKAEAAALRERFLSAESMRADGLPEKAVSRYTGLTFAQLDEWIADKRR